MITLVDIGNKIKKERQKQKLKQEELAQKIGFQQTKISRIETGSLDIINIADLLKICEGLNIGIEKLLFDDGAKHIQLKDIEVELVNNYRTATAIEKKIIHDLLGIEDNKDMDKESAMLLKAWKTIASEHKEHVVKSIREAIELTQKDRIVDLQKSIVTYK